MVLSFVVRSSPVGQSYSVSSERRIVENGKYKTRSPGRHTPGKLLILLLRVWIRVQIDFFSHTFLHNNSIEAVKTTYACQRNVFSRSQKRHVSTKNLEALNASNCHEQQKVFLKVQFSVKRKKE
jgi:hypothetical protein